MRIRHLFLIALAVGAVLMVVRSVAPDPRARPAVIEEGAVNIVATQSGMGAWVPHTVTVRNLSERNDLVGRVLLLKRPDAHPAALQLLTPIKGGPVAPAPLPAVSGGAGPDGAFEFALALSPRHKRTFSFQAPSDFSLVVVEDALGRFVAETAVDDRTSIGVGVLTDSETLSPALEPITIGDLRVRPQTWNERQRFPTRTAELSGLSAIVLDRFDTGRLTEQQLEAMREFVGLGGELVMAGGADLVRTVRKLPPELLPFLADGATATAQLGAVEALAGIDDAATGQVAVGTPAAGATVFLETAGGLPLAVETRYGAGRVVALLFDPDPRLAGVGTAERALSMVAFGAALSRGLDRLPGSPPRGRTLIDPAGLSDGLFPRPADSPFPPLWLIGALMAAYLLLVLPVNYVFLRSLGRAHLIWFTAPALATVFTLALYLAGQSLQSGIRDEDLQFVRLGPDGIASTVDVHGLIFPGRGEHRVEFGAGTLAAPLTVTHAALTPGCERCPFPIASGSAGVEEHVMAAGQPAVEERGTVYGSVRVVGAGTTARGDLRLLAAVDSDSGHLNGIIANVGRLKVQALLVYTFYRGAYRGALVAPGLDPGVEVAFSTELRPIGDVVGNLPAQTRLTPAQLASLLADETGRRTLTHPGQVAVVGFVAPVDTLMRVDGVAPRRTILTAFGLPVEVRSATGRLGDVATVRVAASSPQPEGGLTNSYDIAIPAVSAPIVLRFDQHIYSDVQIYDWGSRRWRPGLDGVDAGGGQPGQTRLAASEIRDGLVRIRAHEQSLSWGAELTVRFLDEAP